MEVLFVDDSIGYVLKIIGDVDASSSIILDNALEEALEATEGNIFIDCFELDYIASAGIGVFTSRLHSQSGGRQIMLYGVNDKIMNTFKVLGLHKLLPLYATKEELISVLADGTANQG